MSNSTSVSQPTPAIVSQNAVQRLPRGLLLVLCGMYVMAGLLGREPWKAADMASFGYMLHMAQGLTSWWTPQMLGLAPETDGPLAYGLGALAIQGLSPWLSAAAAARVPFALLLALTLASTWYAVYYLARSPQAQPVAFAFGGEANPKDYAMAMADAGLLALVACLGLAQLSHEITPMLAQLGFFSLLFFGISVLPFHPLRAWLALVTGLLGLTLSGAPSLSLGAGAAMCLACLADTTLCARTRHALGLLLVLCVLGWIAHHWGLFRWRVLPLHADGATWRSLGRLFLWFTWPVWPLALWTLWRWRSHWTRRNNARHVHIPLLLAVLSVGSALLTASAERTLILALPALSALAAFALPTLRRSVSALIDWFTLLFFTGCALVIWVVWLATQTGWPARPAANVMRLLPGFSPSFQLLAFVLALAISAFWFWLVYWRIGRHRSAIWKSLALPAGGAALCWVLLTTLWLPMLDYARSYAPLVQRVTRIIPNHQCVYALGMTRGQIAGFAYHGPYQLKVLPEGEQALHCDWLIVDADALASTAVKPLLSRWIYQQTLRRPSDNDEDVAIYRRQPRADTTSP